MQPEGQGHLHDPSPALAPRTYALPSTCTFHSTRLKLILQHVDIRRHSPSQATKSMSRLCCLNKQSIQLHKQSAKIGRAECAPPVGAGLGRHRIRVVERQPRQRKRHLRRPALARPAARIVQRAAVNLGRGFDPDVVPAVLLDAGGILVAAVGVGLVQDQVPPEPCAAQPRTCRRGFGGRGLGGFGQWLVLTRRRARSSRTPCSLK